MLHHDIVLSQLLRLVPRHQFDSLAQNQDGKRRQGSLSRWSQFVSLAAGQLGNRHSLHDIESSLAAQAQHRYHLGHQTVTALVAVEFIHPQTVTLTVSATRQSA